MSRDILDIISDETMFDDIQQKLFKKPSSYVSKHILPLVWL